MRRITTFLVATFVLVLMCGAFSTAGAAPTITSGNGITVNSTRDIADRTFDIDLSTPALSGLAVPSGNRVRVTLPRDYATSGKRYPVLYLLHGMMGNYAAWYQQYQAATTAKDAEVILVMPEGGLAGWYTDWVRPTGGVNNWETYHVGLLIPFIDRNLRTIAAREGRAIAGISMGGFGAMHYAESHPELFTSVTSFSGAVSLNLATQAVIAGSPLAQLAPPFAAFGVPFGPAWQAANPVRHASSLAGMDVQIYVANVPTDPVEFVVRMSAVEMRGALNRAGVPHTFVAYGMGGTCWGMHHPGCWVPAFRSALPRILGRLAPAVIAP